MAVIVVSYVLDRYILRKDSATMKERIILAPGISETEMLRTLAKSGVNTIGWRFMNAAQLAKTALMNSGISIEETFLTSKEEPALIL